MNTPSTSSAVASVRVMRPNIWIDVAAIIIVGLALRPSIVSIGPVIGQIQAHYGLTHSAGSLLTSIPDLLMGGLALPTPWLARRFGRDRVILAALVLLTVSTALRGLVEGTASLMATTVGVGAGIAVTGTLLSGFVKARFPHRAALMMGIYSTALSAGSALAAIGTVPLATAVGGWRLAIATWAAFGAIGAVAWLVVARSGDPTSIAPSPSSKPSSRGGLPWREPLAWRIAVYFACNNLIFYALVAWSAAVFVEADVAPVRAGGLLGLFTIGFTMTSATVGVLSRSRDRRAWLAAGAAACMVGALLLSFAPSFHPEIAICALALGLGTAFPLSMTLPLDNTHDAAATNSWTAFILTFGYLVAALGPLGVGFLRDLTGDFHLSMLLLVCVAAVMLALAPLLRPLPNG